MTSSIAIAQTGSASPGIDQPFEMLHACHERLGRMLAQLQKLRSHMRALPADEQARQAARDVMRYFDMAAPQHHRDEADHLFVLQQDHDQMEARWPAARYLLEEVASGTRSAFNEADDMVFDRFAKLYADHIEAEESLAYPRASAAMERERLEVMSQDMMARRGVK